MRRGKFTLLDRLAKARSALVANCLSQLAPRRVVKIKDAVSSGSWDVDQFTSQIHLTISTATVFTGDTNRRRSLSARGNGKTRPLAGCNVDATRMHTAREM